MSGPDAIVVGAGFAGLSAATALAERGQKVLVLEARPGLGGRATAFTDRVTGERVDNGQHVLLGCYHETFAFLRRIGTLHHVHVQPRLEVDVVDQAGYASTLSCPPLPSPLHLAAGVLTWRALGLRDRLSVLRLGSPASLAGSARPDETVRTWLQRRGQTPRVIELLWEPLAVAALNQPIDEAAAAPFTTVLARMFGPDPNDSALAWPTRPLDELYALPARRYIEERGGVVLVNSPARLDVSSLGCRVFVRSEQWRAASVICAVPWFALPDVFHGRPAALRETIGAAERTGASPIVTVNLWFDRPVLTRAFVGLPGRTLQWAFDKREVFGDSASHLSLVSSGAEAVVAKSNEELIATAMRELSEAIPAARGATLRRATAVREKRATFSIAPGVPPRPGTRTGIPGLFLAGDWIDTGLPATIESAVVSGHRAADAAASSYP